MTRLDSLDSTRIDSLDSFIHLNLYMYPRLIIFIYRRLVSSGMRYVRTDLRTVLRALHALPLSLNAWALLSKRLLHSHTQ